MPSSGVRFILPPCLGRGVTWRPLGASWGALGSFVWGVAGFFEVISWEGPEGQFEFPSFGPSLGASWAVSGPPGCHWALLGRRGALLGGTFLVALSIESASSFALMNMPNGVLGFSHWSPSWRVLLKLAWGAWWRS
eukprot:3521277-Pyramimonas_sp.AAC.1